MASGDIVIEGLSMNDRMPNVHPAISELWFNTHHDFSVSSENKHLPINKGYFNLRLESMDFITSLRQLKVKQAYELTPEMLIRDFLNRI